MLSIALPARRTFIAIVIMGVLLYSGYAYAAISVAVIFLLSWVFYPVKQPRDFCAGVIPAIDALTDYLRHLSAGNVSAHAEEMLFKAFNNRPYTPSFIEGFVYGKKNSYPEWVYYSGFNPALRSGFRHFLIQLEHAADVCCSMGYWLSSNEALADHEELMPALRQSIKINIDLLAGLSRTMHHHAEKTLRPVNDTNVDFVSDITALEETLQRLVPSSIELLDMSQDYVQMTAIVRDVKDLREVLLLLVSNTPTG